MSRHAPRYMGSRSRGLECQGGRGAHPADTGRKGYPYDAWLSAWLSL